MKGEGRWVVVLESMFCIKVEFGLLHVVNS